MNKNLAQLIARIVGFKAISFNGHHIFLLKVPMVYIPYSTLAKCQHDLIEKYGFDDVYSIFTGLGKIHGYNGTSIYIKKYKIVPSESDIDFFFEQAKLVGLGNMKRGSVDMKEKYGVIQYYNSPGAIEYKKRYGIQEYPVDFYQLGLVAGSACAFFDDYELIGIEKECLGKGDSKCTIEIKSRDKWKEDKDFAKLIPKKNEYVEKIKSIETLHALLQPVQTTSEVESQLLRYLRQKYRGEVYNLTEEGIKLFKLVGMITPIEILSLLAYTTIKQFGSGAAQVFYDVGVDEGREAIENLKGAVTFNPKSANDVANALDVIGLYGFGRTSVLRADLRNNNLIVKVTENFLAKKYYSYFGTQKINVDHYLAGILAGIASSIFGCEMECEERECVVQGKEACTFELRKKK